MDSINIKSGIACVLCLFLVVSVSCKKSQNLEPVTEIVYNNDKPLEFGSIMFQPVSGQPSSAEIQPDGTFVLHTAGEGEGAVPGINKVRVAAYRIPDQREDQEQAWAL